MRRLTIIHLLCYITQIETSIYLTDTTDRLSVQLYDCLIHQSIFYCRRPLEPISLQRNSLRWTCHEGIQYSFQFLKQNNTTVNEILHGWKSSLDRLEEFVHYLNHSEEIDGSQEYICNCVVGGTFGRYCEYSLPVGITFEETVATIFSYKTTKLNYEGDLVCYKTLECDSGLLCLDWRDICDGRHQCMFGLDEENCDKIEFNECSKDEYRCMNGMCIPEEYFLDGDYDCMDLSDEKEKIEDTLCPFRSPNFECDERICPPCRQRDMSDWNEGQCWSCGDGQCVYERILSRSRATYTKSCRNRRDQLFWCETVRDEALWTLDNGRCTEKRIFDEHNTTDYCHYLRVCQLSNDTRRNCTCKENNSCSVLFEKSCSSWNGTHYPNGGFLAPYLFGYYHEAFRPTLNSAKWKINGSIKCRGYLAHFLGSIDGNAIIYSSHQSDYLCQPQFKGLKVSKQGYDAFCHNSSQTFNNYSYHFIDVCPRTKSCISAYRINDGFGNCLTDDEEGLNEIVKRSCLNVRTHRFRCSMNQTTCLYASVLGDSNVTCYNGYDEYWMDTHILVSQIACNKQSKIGCSILREYIQASWNLSSLTTDQINTFSTKKISFRSYCDVYLDLASKDDENSSLCQTFWRCLPGQWQCSSGQCIPLTSLLNSILDCPDGSDEHNIFASEIHLFNGKYSLVNMTDIVDKFQKIYPWYSLWSVCHLTDKSPCSHKSNSSLRSSNEHCINITILNNENVTCPSQCDEQSIIGHCYLSLRKLGYQLQCLSMKTCVDLSHQFQHHCTNTSHPNLPCQMNDQNGNPLSSSELQCWTAAKTSTRCNNQRGCWNAEDEYMCAKSNKFASVYDRKSKFDFQTKEKQVHLLRYPSHAITTEYQSSMLTNLSNSLSSEKYDSIFNRCNRGIAIRVKNDSIVCFCSPHYHGEQCQYHTDRLSLILHVSYTHSNYTINTDPSIVNKYLVLFLQDDRVLSIDEFHLRPANEFNHTTKIRLYFHYSHSKDSVEQKRQRYFNRSHITDHHPFSIRIEAFELKLNVKPRRFAVWEYSIYFDFLPVYRLVKILQFIDFTNQPTNLCGNNSCHPNEECYQLHNKPSKYKCLCRNQYSGRHCAQLNQLCMKNYCSSNALCQPEYQGLTKDIQWPYCICPLNFIGQRCLLNGSICETSPCQNNGTCYQELRPDQFICICPEEFLGKRCEKQKASIDLYLEEEIRGFNHQANIVQYLRLDLIQLELRLMDQNVYSMLPRQVKYFHNEKTNPDIILLRVHSFTEEQIYLLTVQLNQTRLIANITVDQNNQCQHIQSLISSNQSISVVQYHSLCLNKSRHLLCFYDDNYLCICNDNDLGVECFLRQHEDYRCDECRSNAKCLKGRGKGLICICPLCHSGDRCQFSFESFSFTLDQLFLNDLQPSSSPKKYLIIIILIFIPGVLFILGLLNNLCCFVTFRQNKCRHNGIGEYLLCMSIVNQISLTFLISRFLHLTITSLHSHSSLAFNTVLCKLINYFLLTSTRLTYWLSSLIAIERLYVVVFFNGLWLKNPQTARCISFLLVTMILFLSAYELAFIQSASSSDDSETTVCIMIFPVDTPSWNYLHNVIVIIDALVPFFINLVCTIGIICIVTKKKMNVNVEAAPVSMSKVRTVKDRHTSTSQQTANDSSCPEVLIVSDQTYRQSSRITFHLLITVLMENKELVIAPAFTLIPQLFSLPFFLASLIMKCQNFHGNDLRYLLIVSYFTKFAPQLTSFLLYISPSSFYFKQWQCSTLSSWMNCFLRTSPRVTLTSITNCVNEKPK